MGESGIFEWDDEKDARNFAKHKLHFRDCFSLFDDAYTIIAPDESHSWHEQRMIAIGLAGNAQVLVVFVQRENKLRLISARHADRKEWNLYLKQFL